MDFCGGRTKHTAVLPETGRYGLAGPGVYGLSHRDLIYSRRRLDLGRRLRVVSHFRRPADGPGCRPAGPFAKRRGPGLVPKSSGDAAGRRRRLSPVRGRIRVDSHGGTDLLSGLGYAGLYFHLRCPEPAGGVPAASCGGRRGVLPCRAGLGGSGRVYQRAGRSGLFLALRRPAASDVPPAGAAEGRGPIICFLLDGHCHSVRRLRTGYAQCGVHSLFAAVGFGGGHYADGVFHRYPQVLGRSVPLVRALCRGGVAAYFLYARLLVRRRRYSGLSLDDDDHLVPPVSADHRPAGPGRQDAPLGAGDIFLYPLHLIRGNADRAQRPLFVRTAHHFGGLHDLPGLL